MDVICRLNESKSAIMSITVLSVVDWYFFISHNACQRYNTTNIEITGLKLLEGYNSKLTLQCMLVCDFLFAFEMLNKSSAHV